MKDTTQIQGGNMNEVNKVSHAELVTIAEEAKATGLFFTAEFIKKTDGTYRVMSRFVAVSQGTPTAWG